MRLKAVGVLVECPVVLTKLKRDIWRRALHRLAILFGMIVTIGFGVIITFAWMALLAHGFAALISWAI